MSPINKLHLDTVRIMTAPSTSREVMRIATTVASVKNDLKRFAKSDDLGERLAPVGPAERKKCLGSPGTMLALPRLGQGSSGASNR